MLFDCRRNLTRLTERADAAGLVAGNSFRRPQASSFPPIFHRKRRRASSSITRFPLTHRRVQPQAAIKNAAAIFSGFGSPKQNTQKGTGWLPLIPHPKRIPKRVSEKNGGEKSEPVRLSGSVRILQRYSPVVEALSLAIRIRMVSERDAAWQAWLSTSCLPARQLKKPTSIACRAATQALTVAGNRLSQRFAAKMLSNCYL